MELGVERVQKCSIFRYVCVRVCVLVCLYVGNKTFYFISLYYSHHKQQQSKPGKTFRAITIWCAFSAINGVCRYSNIALSGKHSRKSIRNGLLLLFELIVSHNSHFGFSFSYRATDLVCLSTALSLDGCLDASTFSTVSIFVLSRKLVRCVYWNSIKSNNAFGKILTWDLLYDLKSHRIYTFSTGINFSFIQVLSSSSFLWQSALRFAACEWYATSISFWVRGWKPFSLYLRYVRLEFEAKWKRVRMREKEW